MHAFTPLNTRYQHIQAISSSHITTSLSRLSPQLPHLHDTRNTRERTNHPVAQKPGITAPVHGQRRPGQLPHHRALPRGRDLAASAGRSLGRQPAQVDADVDAPQPDRPLHRPPLLGGRPAHDALARQVRAVLERLEDDAGDQLRVRDRRVQRRGSSFDLLSLFGGLLPGQGLRDELLGPEVHAQQRPEPEHRSSLGQQAGELVEPLREYEAHRCEAGDGEVLAGQLDDRRLVGRDEGDPVGRAAAEVVGRERGEDRPAELGGVADELQDRVDARRRGHALVQVGEEGVDARRCRGCEEGLKH